MDPVRTFCITGILLAFFGLLLVCHAQASDTEGNDSDEVVAHERQKRWGLKWPKFGKTKAVAGSWPSAQSQYSPRSSIRSLPSSRSSMRSLSNPKESWKSKLWNGYLAPFLVGSSASAAGSAIGGIGHEAYAVSKRNRAPYFSSCPKDGTIDALPRQTKAKYTWVVPIANDPDDENMLTPMRTQGPPSDSDFSEGVTEIRYQVSDRHGLQAVCTFSVTVRVITCPDPPVFHLTHRRCDVENVYGSVCYHICEPGYYLKGAANVTCHKTGQWSSEFPTCEEDKVPVFDSCPSDATVTAPASQTTANYTWDVPTVRDSEGERLSVVQKQGPLPGGTFRDGTTTVLYTVTNSRGLSSVCSFTVTVKVNRCSDPTNLPLLVDQSCDMNWEYVSGSVCSHTCRKGYRLVGPANVTCQEVNGELKWSDDIPKCEVIKCQPQPNPPNGNFHCTKGSKPGSLCSVDCEYGYQVQGVATVECRDNGTWSGNMAECGGIECPAPPVVANGALACSSGRQHPAFCTLLCDEGLPSGNSTIQCQGNGRWSRPGRCGGV